MDYGNILPRLYRPRACGEGTSPGQIPSRIYKAAVTWGRDEAYGFGVVPVAGTAQALSVTLSVHGLDGAILRFSFWLRGFAICQAASEDVCSAGETPQTELRKLGRGAMPRGSGQEQTSDMAQIFVSHSAKDRELRSLVANAFSATPVKAVFEEFEATLKGPANAQRIAQHIRESNAVFVLLGKHVEELKHTRDWVAWESGVAAATALQTNKDVWVLESIKEMDALSVVIPHLRHYVCLDESQEFWQGYLTQIILSYDDSHFLRAMSAGAATGAALGKGEGALWGAGAGLVFAAMASQATPTGFPTRCPKCWSCYFVHLAEPRMRCPVCNTRLLFPAQ